MSLAFSHREGYYHGMKPGIRSSFNPPSSTIDSVVSQANSTSHFPLLSQLPLGQNDTLINTLENQVLQEDENKC